MSATLGDGGGSTVARVTDGFALAVGAACAGAESAAGRSNSTTELKNASSSNAPPVALTRDSKPAAPRGSGAAARGGSGAGARGGSGAGARGGSGAVTRGGSGVAGRVGGAAAPPSKRL